MNILIVLAAIAHLSAASAEPLRASPTVYSYRVERVFPHDRNAFTQGLIFSHGHIYESTGNFGRSTVRQVRLEDGRVLNSVSLPADIFGEGLTLWNNELISITWRHGIGYRWDRASLRRLGQFQYPGEGWGLTHDGRHLIMSDGTSEIRFIDPTTFRELNRINVTFNGQPVRNLNELEWVEGEIFANVWQTDYIVRINPESGVVVGWVDLSPLAATVERQDSNDVLNGIAYDPAGDRLFVTGKNWPFLYQIRLEALASSSPEAVPSPPR